MEVKFLNRKAVFSLLDQCISNGKMLDFTSAIMLTVGAELQQLCAEYSRPITTDKWSTLARYANLKPSDLQIRKALDMLMQQGYKGRGKRDRLFNNTRQWLAVQKVLAYLKVLKGDYGCMSAMEAYVRTLYIGSTPPEVPCRQDAMQKKNREPIFCNMLEQWETKRASPQMRDYWTVAITLLQNIEQVCHEEEVYADGEHTQQPK